MTKKILAMLLAVALVVSLAVPALAEEYPEVYHCECGAKWFASAEEATPSVKNGECMNGCGDEKNLTWTPLSEAVASGSNKVLPSAAGNYYLAKDIVVTYPTYTTKNIRLDLNGHSITRSAHKILSVQGGSYVITDTSDKKDGSIAPQSVTANSQYGVAVTVKLGGTVKMLAGTLDASKVSKNDIDGCAVTVGRKDAADADRGGSFTMYGGTIIGGTGKRGGSVLVMGSQASFTMYDGIIRDGITIGDDGHGGNVHVREGAQFTMNGGAILDGHANGLRASGGNIAVISAATKLAINGGVISGGSSTYPGSSVWIHNGVNDTNSMIVTGSPVINSIYLTGTTASETPAQTITIGDDGLTAGAQIGVEMQYTGTFVSSGADARDISYFIPQHNDTYITLSGGKLCMTTDIGSNTAAIGFGLYPTINDAIAAITDRTAQSVKVVQDTNETVTVTGDLYLDLNGKTLSGNITVNNGTLKVFDSQTDDYSVADEKYGKITGTVMGDVADDFVHPATNYRYITVSMNEGISAHRIYLAVTHSVINSKNYSAMNFKTVFKCDEVVAAQVKEYGFTVGSTNTPYPNVVIDSFNGMNLNEKTTTITGFLQEDGQDNQQYAELVFGVNAYITLKDNKTVNSAVKSRSLKQMIEGTLSQWDEKLTVSQKKTLKKMYETYNVDNFMDNWANIEKVKGLSNDASNSISSVGYSAVDISPTSDMFGKVGLMGFGNESTRLVTSVDKDYAPLKAICVAVTDRDGNTVLLISVDSASVGNGVAKQIVSQISANYGVPEGNIMISSNHQHSTPVFGGMYDALFVSRVVESARLALADRKEVVGMTAQIVEVGENNFNFVRNVQYADLLGRPIAGAMKTDNHDDANRITGSSLLKKVYESTADDDVQLVKITREGASPILLTNFQTHPHMATDSSKTVATADIIGVFRDKLAELTGCEVMYFTGASGNINAWSNIDTNKEKEDLDYITQGRSLAEVVANGIQDSAWISVVSESTGGVATKTVTKQYSVMLNSVPSWLSGKTMDEIVSYAANFWNATDGYLKNTTASDLKNYGIYSKYHAKYIIMRSTNKETDTKSLTISAIAIGDLAFVVVPYEMYDTNGMWIKENSPYKMTFTTHLADMPTSNRASFGNGYIPSAQSYVNGGYSVDIAQFAAGTGEKVAQDYIYILNELYN